MKETKKIKKHKRFKVLAIIAVVLVLIVGTSLFCAYYFLDSKYKRINHIKINDSPRNIGIDPKTYKPGDAIESNYINILLFGIDARDVSTPSRTDCIMVLTIDKKHSKIKITSIMRDSLVDMKGEWGPMLGKNQDRLNHAYAYGEADSNMKPGAGATYAMKIINENFNMNIKDYVKVDFIGLEKIIDSIGGVQINVANDEVPLLNDDMDEVASIEKVKPVHVAHSGLQTLTGAQAVGYCRIRHVGNNDYQRTERQRTVLSEMFKKLSQRNIFDISSSSDAILPYVETSLDKNEITSIAKYILLNKVSTIDQLRIPTDDQSYTVTVDDSYFLGFNKQPTIDTLHKFIYEGDLP